jgi:hypothetical protein
MIATVYVYEFNLNGQINANDKVAPPLIDYGRVSQPGFRERS